MVEKGDIEKVPGAVLEPLARVLHTTPAYLMGWEDAPAAGAVPPGFEPLPEMTAVPRVGEHTDAILLALGRSAEQVAALRAAQAI